MGLIDSKKAIKALTHWETEATDEEIIYTINNLPTVEAIPKAEYENRLKADMVTMLEELLKELKELPKARFYETNEFDDVTGCIDYPAISKNALDLIQQKINELEEQRDETDKSNK